MFKERPKGRKAKGSSKLLRKAGAKGRAQKAIKGIKEIRVFKERPKGRKAKGSSKLLTSWRKVVPCASYSVVINHQLFEKQLFKRLSCRKLSGAT